MGLNATKPLIVAGIPAYNEEATIAKVIVGTQKYVDKVVVYDDGSSDMTADIAERLGAKVMRGEVNLGKGEAMRSIFRSARELGASALVTIDADAQHNPDEIPKLLEELKDDEVDIVIGSRFIANASSIPGHRRGGNVLLSLLTEGKLNGAVDTQSGFRAYGKRAIDAIRPGESGMAVDSEILMDARDVNLTVEEVPVSVSYKGRTSKHNAAYHGFDVLASVVKLTSIRHPLLFYAVPGLVLFLVGLGFGFNTLQIFAETKALPTNFALVAVSATFIGLLAMFTGIILFTITTVVRNQD